MNIETSNLLLGAIIGAAIATIFFTLVAYFRKPRTFELVKSCLKCGCKKLVNIENEPNKYYCPKCHSVSQFPVEQQNNIPSPAPLYIPPEQTIAPAPQFACKLCQKAFETEKGLRKHIGMSHYDKIEI